MLASSLVALAIAALAAARPMHYQLPRHLQHLVVQKRVPVPAPKPVAAPMPVAVAQKRQAAGIDFGTCADPTIIFADGLDGRKEASFAPANKGDFSQGSALNPNIITSFICGRLKDSCKANQAALDACAAGQAATQGQKGQAAADAFNNAILGGAGGAGGGAAVAQAGAAQAQQAAGADAADADAACAGQTVVTVTVEVDAPLSTPALKARVPQPITPTRIINRQTGNQQSFTGALGGIAAPAVNPGGKGFIINGSEFINLNGALGRSCDVQKNACANAANSGQGDFSVSDCDAQAAACRGAI